MCSSTMNFHQMTLLRRRQFRLLAAQVSFGFGDKHPFACSRTDEIGFELGHHGENVEQQPTNRVGRVVHGPADAELDAFDREFVDEVLRIPQRTRQPVEFGDDESVTVAAGSEGLSQSGACPVGAAETVVSVDRTRSVVHS